MSAYQLYFATYIILVICLSNVTIAAEKQAIKQRHCPTKTQIQDANWEQFTLTPNQRIEIAGVVYQVQPDLRQELKPVKENEDERLSLLEEEVTFDRARVTNESVNSKVMTISCGYTVIMRTKAPIPGHKDKETALYQGPLQLRADAVTVDDWPKEGCTHNPEKCQFEYQTPPIKKAKKQK